LGNIQCWAEEHREITHELMCKGGGVVRKHGLKDKKRKTGGRRQKKKKGVTVGEGPNESKTGRRGLKG